MKKMVLSLLIFSLIASIRADEGAAQASRAAAAELRTALALSGVPARGYQLFATCAACHGVDGMGQGDGTAPVIAAQYREVVLRQLVDYRYSLRWDLRMEHVAQLRNLQLPQDLADVAAYVASLEQRAERTGIGRGEHLAQGASKFIDRCAQCHGATGQGKASQTKPDQTHRGRGTTNSAVPKLAGQHHAYLLRQFLDVMEGRRPALGASHRRVMSDFDQALADGIADYLSRNSRGSTTPTR